jgi:hypothetical protein
MALSESSTWTATWPSLKAAAPLGELRFECARAETVVIRLVSSAGDVPLSRTKISLRSEDGRLTLDSTTDLHGTIALVAPRGSYVVTLGALDLGSCVVDESLGSVLFRVPGHGVISGEVTNITDPVPEGLELCFGAATCATGRRESPFGTHVVPGRRDEAHEFRALLASREWKVPVPWPLGTEVSVALMSSGVPLGPSQQAVVGSGGVRVTRTEALPVTLTIRGTRESGEPLVGSLAIRRKGMNDPAGARANTPRGAETGWFRRAPIEADGQSARLKGVPRGTYEVVWVWGARGAYRTSSTTVEVADSDLTVTARFEE